MSRLIDIDPQAQPEPEPEGYEFGYYTFDELPSLEVSNIESTHNSITDTETGDASGNNFQKFPISDVILHKLQQEDAFCKSILNQMEKGNIADGQLYLVLCNPKFISKNNQYFSLSSRYFLYPLTSLPKMVKQEMPASIKQS